MSFDLIPVIIFFVVIVCLTVIWGIGISALELFILAPMFRAP